MDETLIELSARMSFHEFLLEVHHANFFGHSTDPDAELAAFRNTAIERIRYRSTPVGSDDTAAAMAVQDRLVEIAERYFDRVAERMQDVVTAM